VAGLGNIYVDEALFRARISPLRQAGQLTAPEITRLHRSIIYILTAAVKYRGTTFNNYVDANGRTGSYFGKLKVYGRGGLSCTRCTHVLTKVKLGGRGTVYCERCQT
jgi:formamidopyrimidine-DNA glycosylase